jgi:Fe-S-cluster containining protein
MGHEKNQKSKNGDVIESLHANVSSFFENFFSRYQGQMKCGLGCASCCISGITVFPAEAQLIKSWFLSLDPERQRDIASKWQESTPLGAESGSPGSCVFLVSNVCSIYPVRPTLCRSQGLPLKIKTDTEIELSLCELNFQGESDLPPSGEWLDLDRLNTLLVIANQAAQAARFDTELQALIIPETGRISLILLQSHLLKKMG